MLPILYIENYFDKSLAVLAADIFTTRKKIVGDIKLRDLAATARSPYGVYVLADHVVQGQCLYVGKVSSRSYAERVPMHFDPRAKAWMNQFTRKLSDAQFSGDYAKALLHGLDQYIVFVSFPFTETDEDDAVRAKSINRLETLLRRQLKPILNLPKRGDCESDKTIGELLIAM